MEQFEDIDAELREGTYLGTLPKELRQLTTRYRQSCNYQIYTNPTPGKLDRKAIVISDKEYMIRSYIPFQRGVRNTIGMQEFILDIKAGRASTYNITPAYALQHRRGMPSFTFGLYHKGEALEPYISIFTLCYELEETLLRMEVFQNSQILER